MKTLLLLVALLLGGCSMRPIETLSISSEDFTPEQQEIIMQGFDAWPHALEVTACEGSGCTVVLGDCEGTVGGYTDLHTTKAARIVICPISLEDEETLRIVAAHELGHALVGASDHLPAGNVMAPTVPEAVSEPTALDLQYVGLR